MAALYLHNAIHTPDYEPKTSVTPHHHQRNTSSVSGATLVSTFEYSHPTEPLLQSNTSESVAYLDLLSRQPSHPDGPRPGWTTSLSLDGDPISSRERKLFREHFLRKQLRRLRLYKGLLEVAMGTFAIYNTVRYFLAFTLYDSRPGQATSLALGISTGVSFAFSTCAFILSLFQPYLLVHQVPVHLLLRTRTALHALASFTLFGPAAVNMALLFVWKDSAIGELNLQRRCHVDIDVVWSITGATECIPPAWAVWITLSVLRLVITIVIIISYHWVATLYHHVRRPSSRSRRPHSRGISSESYHSSIPSSVPGVSPLSFVVPQHTPRHHSSESTLHSHPRSKHSSSHLASHSGPQLSTYSDEEESDTETQHQAGGSSNTNVELDNFNDQFRSIVSRITQETEVALQLARAENSPSPPPTSNEYTVPRMPPTIGYDEFGQPYPPDEHVPILNVYVRRMPTIESMGSREGGSMTASSLYSDRDTVTTSVKSPPSSRPPTRADTLSASEYSHGSHSPSRSNSLSAGAEILLNASRTNELGEFVDRTLADNRPSSSVSTGSSFPSTTSYYTATSFGGLGSDRAHSPSPMLKTDHL